MRRPRLLDLFCKAGGCSKGYADAGFDVVGVDIEPQRHYPFEFIQADALTFALDGFDVVHASPPCQGYSRMRHLPWLAGREYPMLIEPMRERLAGAFQRGAIKGWVMENVEGAPILNGINLCGTMVGLPIYRHRLFECSHVLLSPPHQPHRRRISAGPLLGDRARNPVHEVARQTSAVRPGISAWQAETAHPRRGPRATPNGLPVVVGIGGHFGGADLVREAMGIPWMTRDELSQAIPPAYTRLIGEQLLDQLGRAT